MRQPDDSSIGEGDQPELQQWELKAWRRLSAGLLVEQGLGDKEVAKRWQAYVKAGDFDPDRFAEELLAAGSTKPAEVESKLLVRSARLERDLMMTPLLRGASGVGRRARGAARTGIAAGMTQFIVLGIYSILIFLFLLVLSFKGVQLDPFFHSIVDVIPAMPESAP